MNPLDLLFGFSGRVGRGQFWLSVLIYVVFYVVVIGLTMLTGSLTATFGMALLAYAPVLLSAVAVGIKRLHDRNKTGWWLAAFYGIPLAFQFVVPILFDDADPDAMPMSVTILQYLGSAMLLWGLIELGAIRGSIGGNSYGPDPVAPKPAKH